MNRSILFGLLDGIVAFHRSLPHEEAVAGIAAHIRQFWEPRMRTALAEALDDGSADIDPMIREAILRAVEPRRRDAA